MATFLPTDYIPFTKQAMAVLERGWIHAEISSNIFNTVNTRTWCMIYIPPVHTQSDNTIFIQQHACMQLLDLQHHRQ
jgi:hypothetical protein